jgi:hypothetical protein
MQSYPISTSFVPYTPIIPPYPYNSSVLEYSTLQNSFSTSPTTTTFSLKSEDSALDEEIMKYKLERLGLLEKLRELETMYNDEEEDEDFKFITPGLTTEENKECSHSIEDDEAFARKLLLEEKKMISEGAKTQKLQEEFENGMDEILNDGELSQDLTQLEKDARFAAQLEKIFRSQQQNQIDEDERLARHLSDLENPGVAYNRNTYTPPVAVPPKVTPGKKKSTRFPKPAINSIITMNKTTPTLRNHAVAVHNNFCTCRKTDAGNNGHLFKIHDQNCKCTKLHMKS